MSEASHEADPIPGHAVTPTPAGEVLAALIDASLALSGQRMDHAWREGVLAHMSAIATAAKLVLDFPLDDEIEQAPVYEAAP